MFPRFSSCLDASSDAGVRDVVATERELLSLPGRRLLCGKVTVKPWCPGTYLGQVWSEHICVLHITVHITVQSLKVLTSSKEQVEVFSNQEEEQNRKRIHGKSILASRLACHCVRTALCRTNPQCPSQNQGFCSQSYKVLRSVRSEGIGS